MTTNAMPNDFDREAGSFAPFVGRTTGSLPRNHRVRASIAPLLGSRRPSAIGRSVVAFVVDTINRVMLRWTRTHVSIKGDERLTPFIADRNTTGTVEAIVAGCGRVAAIDHRGPDIVFSRPFSAVLDLALTEESQTLTSAGLDDIGHEHVGREGLLSSAVTPTQPVGCFWASFWSGHTMKHGQEIESLAVGQLVSLPHRHILPCFGVA
jgi:hypothetical protein